MSADAESVVADASVFVEIVSNYFRATGGGPPEILPGSLEWGLPEPLDTTGYMPVSGALSGWIAVSLSDLMSADLLDAMGEDEWGTEVYLDLSAEMTNTITSNARSHFGNRMVVSPPVSVRADQDIEDLEEPDVTFKLPFRWQRGEGYLLLALH